MEDQKKIAKKVVKEILEDLNDRSGLQNEWEAIDKDIQKEIIATWTKIVETNIK